MTADFADSECEASAKSSDSARAWSARVLSLPLKKRRGNAPKPLTLHIEYCTIIRKSSTGPDTERSVRGDKTWTKLRKKPGGVKFIKI